MKRLIAAVSFAVIASPVLATPFEQTELDRQQPNVATPAAPQRSADRASLPFEQTQLDRQLPFQGEVAIRYASVASDTRTDAVSAGATNAPAENVWAEDHSFIAPAK